MRAQMLLPSISDLLAFQSAARYASFTRAAEELNLTPSAVSRAISADTSVSSSISAACDGTMEGDFFKSGAVTIVGELHCAAGLMELAWRPSTNK